MQQTCARGTPHFSLHFVTCAREASHYFTFFCCEIHIYFTGISHFFYRNFTFCLPEFHILLPTNLYFLLVWFCWPGKETVLGDDQAGPFGRAGLAWSTLAWAVPGCSRQRWSPEQPAGAHLCQQQHSATQANVTQARPTQPKGQAWSSPKQSPCQASQLSLPRQLRAVGRCETLWRE